MNNKKIMKIIFSIITIITCLFVFNTISQAAASFDASISKTSVTVGDTFTVTVKANNAAGMYSVTSSNSNVSISSGSSSEFLENGSATITFKAAKAGNVTITASATDMTDLDDDTKTVTGSKTFSVTVKEKATTTDNNNNNNSNSSGGSNTTTAPEPTFSSVNQTVYAKSEVNVRASYSTSSSILGSLEQGDSVTRTGIGSNGWSKVTYNGKTAYISSQFLTTTKPEEKKEEEKSNNKNLKSLTVTPAGIDPDFIASTTEYTMTVGADVDTIKVDAVAEDAKAKVSVSGNNNLKVGTNTISIKVTAEDETVRTYKIIVTKEEKEKLKLKELLVGGMPLQPEFDSNIYEYTLTLDNNDVSELNITATPNKEKASVEILGNTQLKAGENTITILVKSDDSDETATYQIKVNVPETQKVAEKTNGNDLFKYIGIGILGGILIIVIIIVISKRRKNNEEVDIDNLPELEDEDLPKSLRKNKENEEDNAESEESIDDLYENKERRKKIDDFYANDEDENLNRKRGKHF